MDKFTERIRRITLDEMKDTKYFYNEYLIGCLVTVLYKSGIPRENPINPEYFETFIDAFYESFYGGCEPEFETEEQYRKHCETLNAIRNDFVWSYPKYSKELNEYLFGRNGIKNPIIINIHNIQSRITFLQKCFEGGEHYCYQHSNIGNKMWRLTKEFFG